MPDSLIVSPNSSHLSQQPPHGSRPNQMERRNIEGLSEEYKLLADFNGAVLAGKSSEYGVQFVTWEWSYDQTGLWQGHYYGNNDEGAKQDFAVRADLIQKSQLFSDEQLAEIYRCLHKTVA